MALLTFAVAVLFSVAESVEITATVGPLRIDGLVAAVFTPFDAASNVNFTVVSQQSKYLQDTGVEWVFVGGTTGESLSLTVDERKQLATEWIATGTNSIVHVGAESIRDAQELAAHAQNSGAKAIGAMPPVFFKPANAQALALTIAEICRSAPKIPCYYYHIPSMTGYTKPMIDFVEAIAPLVGNFAGVKYTGLYNSPGFVDAARVMAYDNGRLEVFGGREEMMLEALSIGIIGFVGSQFNIAGDLYNKIRETFTKEGLTQANQKKLRNLQYAGTDLIKAWQDPSPEGVNGNKVFMNLAGVPVGQARLPSFPMGDSDAPAFETSFKAFCSEYKLGLKMCM